MSTSVIDVRNVTKRFRLRHESAGSLWSAFATPWRKSSVEAFDALRDVNLSVAQGEFLGVIGRNGSGKSTLLKILAGIYPPTAGAVTIHGSLSPFLELGVGFNPELTAAENMMVNGLVLGLSRARLGEIADSIIAFAGLEKSKDLKLKTFSSGMLVRLAFAIVSHVPADIYLFDEIFAVGDTEFQERCSGVFQRLREQQKTVILVSHDLEGIRAICDRAMLLEHGECLGDGPPDNIIARYHRLLSERTRDKLPTAASATRWGDRRATITAIHLHNAAGKQVQQSAQGEDITIVMDVLFNSDCRHPIFGITLRDTHGRNVFVTNTAWRSIPTRSFAAGDRIVVEWAFTQTLSRGTYTISPAVAHEHRRAFHDWWEEALTFRVEGPYESGGIVDFPHNVTIRRAEREGPAEPARVTPAATITTER